MISNELLSTITKILIKDEGLKSRPYRDSRNFWTIGVGHYIGPNLEDMKLPLTTVMNLLENDICTHWTDAIEIFGRDFLEKLPVARQAAILSLVFSLGKNGLLKFKETLPAILAEDWQRAEELLLKSKWARDVDPAQREGEGRDDRIAFMLRNGEIHEDYNS